MSDVVIEVLGGVVQNVAVNGRGIRVVVIDWDNINEDASENQLEWERIQDARSLTADASRLYQRLIQK